MVKAYLATSMTGRPYAEIIAEAKSVIVELNGMGIECSSPAIEEGVPNTSEVCPIRTDAEGLALWKHDKQVIIESHVLIDLTPQRKSEGVAHEIGFMRYLLWKPVVRVYPIDTPPAMIATFEDDAIVFSIEEAGKVINERWGTWFKRFCWRVKILQKGIPKFFWYQLKFLAQ